MNKKLLLYILLASVLWVMPDRSVSLRAQTFQPLSPYGNITPSVETFTMTRYGSLVPSLYTGAMTFSVPVYTYTDPDFTIPVSLEYNYDGYKPSQHSGTVGLGWSLNCGGVITREIRGLPDEGSYSGSRLVGWLEARDSAIFYTSDRIMSLSQAGVTHGPLSYPTEHELDILLDTYDPSHDSPIYVKGNLERWYDTAPDLYHFDFCGYRGDFVIMQDGSVRVYNANVPHGELSVRVYSINEALTPTIEVTTAQGYVYTFGDGDIETAHSRPAGDENLRFTYGLGLPGIVSLPAGVTSTTITALRLSRIQAPNGRRVQFNYAPIRQWELFVNTDWFDKGNFRSLHEETVVSNACSSPMGSVVLSDGSRIDFSYEQKQFDEDASTYFNSQYAGDSEILSDLRGLQSYWFDPKSPSRRLNRITVHNASGDLVDSLVLSHKYAQSGTPKMFLKSVSSLRSGTYSFEYYDAYTFPKQDHLGYDHWGYWNGKGNTDIHTCLATDQATGYPVTGLYAQMATTQKNPDPAYSLCGALQKITYPTGGTSSVEYEGNTVSSRIQDDRSQAYCTPYAVGGLRVSRIVDRTGEGRADTTQFRYSDPSNCQTSGMLRQMPRHSFRQDAWLSGTTSEDGGTTLNSYSKHAPSVSYSNRGFFCGPRDHFIGYRYVTQVHPDGSGTRTHFQSAEDSGGYGLPVSKIGPSGIELTSTSPHYIGLEPSVDRRNLRGLPVSRTVIDADGNTRSVEEFTYDSDIVTVDSLLFNEVASFYLGSYSAVGAYPGVKQQTNYFYGNNDIGNGSLTRTERIVYNALGQRVSEQVISTGDTLETRYRYLQETGTVSPSGFTHLLCDAAILRHAGGRTYLVDAEHYDYGIADNPHPTRITHYDVGDGIDVTGLGNDAMFTSAQSNSAVQYDFQYDSKFRLTRASFPGGAWITYTWEGNHVASKAVNGASNKTLYSWIDLIGLAGMTDPSGREETYGYDAHNRPYKVIDADGNTVSVMHYHLQNDL